MTTSLTTPVLQKYQPYTQPQLGGDGLYLKQQLQQISNSLNLLVGRLNGALIAPAIQSFSGAAATIPSGVSSVIVGNGSSAMTVTLPTCVSGQFIFIKNNGTGALNSASSNVVPLASGIAGTAIWGSGGKFAILIGGGAGNWQVFAAG